jgi:nicotinamide mononucleotide transporter
MMNWDNLLEILGLGVGLLYLWWEYRANALVWLASVVMPMISLWIYFRNGLYADFAINIYYLLIAVYGYVSWTWRSHRATPSDKLQEESKGEKPALRISHIPQRVLFGCVVAAGLLWLVLAEVLMRWTNSTVPVTDAFTTALSIVALWMMARKYAEQWLVWLVVDAVCVPLYVYKGIYFYAVLYAVYTVIAYFGYRKWLRLMNEGE